MTEKTFNNGKIKITDNEITYDAWVSNGFMKTRRDALDIDDPEHVYNYLRRFDIDPSQFGIPNPREEKFKDFSRDDLINEILRLEKEICSVLQWT